MPKLSIVQYGEVEKTRHHDGKTLKRFCSATRDPMKKKQSGFGIIIAKTRGHVLSPEFSQSRRWAVIEMGLEDMHIKCL